MATCKGNRRNFSFHIHLPFSSILTLPFVEPILHRNSLRIAGIKPFKKLRNKASNTSLAQPCNDIYVLSFVLSLHTFPYLSLPYTPIHITPCGCELLLPGYVFSCMALWLRSWIPPGKWTNNKKKLGKKWGENHRTSRSLGRMMCLYMYDIHNICVRYPCHSDLVQGSTLAGCLFKIWYITDDCATIQFISSYIWCCWRGVETSKSTPVLFTCTLRIC